MENLLKFSLGRNNSKLEKLEKLTGKILYTFSLLSGETCIGANECHAKVVDNGNKKSIWNGPNQKFRCFSASLELAFPTVYKQRKHNTDLIKTVKKQDLQVELIQKSLPEDAEIIRIHIGGDYYSQLYFNSWLKIAQNNPQILFYSYTKSLPFWVQKLDEIPDNFQLTASYGSKFDAEIPKRGLKFAKVIGSSQEAEELGLEIDTDDSHAALPKYKNVSFALALHNKMTKNTWGSEMMKQQKSASKQVNIGSLIRGNEKKKKKEIV